MALVETPGYETLIKGLIALLFPLPIIFVLYPLNRLLVKKIKINASPKLLSAINYFLPSITFVILYYFLIVVSFFQPFTFIILIILQIPVVYLFQVFLKIQLGVFDLASGTSNWELTMFLFMPIFYFIYYAVLNRIIIFIAKILRKDISGYLFSQQY